MALEINIQLYLEGYRILYNNMGAVFHNEMVGAPRRVNASVRLCRWGNLAIGWWIITLGAWLVALCQIQAASCHGLRLALDQHCSCVAGYVKRIARPDHQVCVLTGFKATDAV